MAVAKQVAEVLVALQKKSTKKVCEGLLRFGIPNDKAIGVSVGDLRTYAKGLGRDQAPSGIACR